ncbi:hypothetical protein GQ457_02G011750 [Hibiscus cannabinus]
MGETSDYFLVLLFSILLFSSSSHSLTEYEVASIAHRQLSTLPENAWKNVVYSDPLKITQTWEGVYNKFKGGLPCKLFEKDLDSVFLNNNRFRSKIPETLGSSPAFVIVFANNQFSRVELQSSAAEGEGVLGREWRVELQSSAAEGEGGAGA